MEDDRACNWDGRLSMHLGGGRLSMHLWGQMEHELGGGGRLSMHLGLQPNGRYHSCDCDCVFSETTYYQLYFDTSLIIKGDEVLRYWVLNLVDKGHSAPPPQKKFRKLSIMIDIGS